jgi:hypothetical protein
MRITKKLVSPLVPTSKLNIGATSSKYNIQTSPNHLNKVEEQLLCGGRT